MGMYDEIMVHALGDTVFQTKDFSCTLSGYYVSADGILSAVNPNNDEWTIPNKTNVNKVTGPITFYGYRDNKYEEYRATFRNRSMVLLEKLVNGEWKKRNFSIQTCIDHGSVVR